MYDSTKDHLEHKSKVCDYLLKFTCLLQARGELHDHDKLHSPLKEIFDKYTPMLRESTFLSDEYNQTLADMGKFINLHYEISPHHPQHYENGIQGMSLIDLCEMICDWKAATEKQKDGDVLRSIEMNQARFGYSDELKQILINTVTRYLSND